MTAMGYERECTGCPSFFGDRSVETLGVAFTWYGASLVLVFPLTRRVLGSYCPPPLWVRFVGRLVSWLILLLRSQVTRRSLPGLHPLVH